MTAIVTGPLKTLLVASCAVLLAACPKPEPTAQSLPSVAELDRQRPLPLVRPPRGIDDIERLLSQESAPPALLKKSLARVAEQPPEDAARAQLITFHRDRSVAAEVIGDQALALADLRRVSELAHSRKVKQSRDIALLITERRLAWMEFYTGNFKAAVEAMDRAFKLRRTSVRNNSIMAEFHAALGDVEAAKEAAATSESLMGMGRRGRNWGLFNIGVNGYAVLEAEGRWREADPFIRQTIADLEKELWAEHKGVWLPGVFGRSKEEYIALTLADYRIHLAENLIRQKRLVDAELETRRLLRDLVYTVGRVNLKVANATAVLAKVLELQGRTKDAQRLNHLAIELMEKIGVPDHARSKAAARHQLARALAASGDWDAAAKQFDEVRQNLADNAYLYDLWYGRDIVVSLTLSQVGRTDEAQRLLRDTLKHHQGAYGKDHRNTLLAQAALGAVLIDQESFDEAAQFFRSSVPQLVELDREGKRNREGAPDHWLTHILERYLSLLYRDATRGDSQSANRSFALIDLLGAQKVQQAIAESGARSVPRDPKLAELVRREQDIRQARNSSNQLLASALTAQEGQTLSTLIADLERQISALDRNYEAVRAEIDRSFPDYAELIAPKASDLTAVQALLRPGEVLLVAYPAQTRTYLWYLAPGREPLLQAAAPGREQLTQMVMKLRDSLLPKNGKLQNYDLQTAAWLYDTLVRPGEALVARADHLLLVSHGVLGTLPFAMLPSQQNAQPADGDLFDAYRQTQWLGVSHALSVIPSVATLEGLRRQEKQVLSAGRFLGVGDPIFSLDQVASATASQRAVALANADAFAAIGQRNAPATRSLGQASLASLPRLEDTRDEIVSVAQSLAGALESDLFLGEEASEDTIKSIDMSRYSIVSFATHGLLAGDLDGLDEPALALSSPAVTGGDQDGLLLMSEILGLEMNADWVVLSACNTGAADGRGVEAVSGLGRAFFYAGARSLLVSQWPVFSDATTKLMAELFRFQAQQPNLSRAQALQLAIKHIIEKEGIRLANGQRLPYSHPVFWAPFVVVGDGGDSLIGS